MFQIIFNDYYYGAYFYAFVQAIQRLSTFLCSCFRFYKPAPIFHQPSNLSNLQTILDLMHEAVVLLNENGKMLLLNDAATALFQKNQKQLLNMQFLYLITETNRELFLSYWQKRDEGNIIFQIEINTGFNKFAANVHIKKSLLENKNIYILSIEDIRAKLAVEEALHAKNLELETLIYKISHDLRGPLTSIFGLVNLTKMEMVNLKNLHNYIHLIEKTAVKLDNTIKDLIFFNEIFARPSIITKFEASSVIVESLQDVLQNEECNNVTFNILMDTDVEMQSDITLIKNILYNLITNSVKYRKKNITTMITIKIQQIQQKIEIEIIDNGIGIADNIQEKVFDMFYRGNTKAAGSGLGLFLVKQSVTKLHGEIKLHSKINEGTCFKIILPIMAKYLASA